MTKKVKNFFEHEASAGIVLFFVAVFAVICQNSPLRELYHLSINTEVEIRIGDWSLTKEIYHWIDDFLMAIFFLLVGLEVKREVCEGELSSAKDIALPAFAAIGGMAVPAFLFYLINQFNSQALDGWAIPTATDIAFSLGVLALLGGKLTNSLRVFLTTLAIFDDLGAIIIIALFYTDSLSQFSLGMAAILCTVLFLLNRFRVVSLIPYIIIGHILWICVLKSGIHATLAGVVVALAIPMRDDETGESPLKHLEHAIHPWVAFLILPLFAFTNSGIDLGLLSWESLTSPVALGVIVGLFLGKQIGVFLFSYLAIKLRIASVPTGATLMQVYGVSILTGIGFTMSLFIGSLAYTDDALVNSAKAGTIVGSLLSGVVGFAILYFSTRKNSQSEKII